MARSGSTEASGEAGDRTAGLDPALDGFYLPVPKRVEERIGKQRESGKKDYSIFTLDYAFRKVGGRQAAVELARLASGNDQRLRGLVESYDGLTPGQKKHKVKLLEQLCIDNGLDPSEFLGICTAVAHRFQLDTSAILASVELENVVTAGVEQAKRPEGVQDRRLIYEHSTFIPQRGPGVAIQVNSGQQQAGVSLPEFRSLSEIALQAIARAALPPAPEGEKEDFIDATES